MQRKEVVRLERRINTCAERRRPKNKRLALAPSSEGIMVAREKQALPAVSAMVGNIEYRRSYQFGNLSSEKLVRINLAKFVAGVKDAVRAGLADGRLAIEENEIRNSIFEVEGICADFDGMDARGFVDGRGKPLARNLAFRHAIRQFFKDEEFARAVCMAAVFEYLTQERH